MEFKEYIKSIVAGISGFILLIAIMPLFPLLALYVLWLGFTGNMEYNPITQKPERKVFLVWDNDGTVLGVAEDEDNAKAMCTRIGDSYNEIVANIAERNNIDTTELCTYKTSCGFLTYEEAIRNGINFKKHENQKN